MMKPNKKKIISVVLSNQARLDRFRHILSCMFVLDDSSDLHLSDEAENR